VYGWISVNQHLEVNMSNNKQTGGVMTMTNNNNPDKQAMMKIQ
jgi:hypothetical protein